LRFYYAQLDHDIAICFLAPVKRMQVVSVGVDIFLQHYLVAMATTLDKLENKVQIHHPYVTHFNTVKSLQKSVKYIRRYSTKMRHFLAMLYPTFTNEQSQLWSYWTKFREIFTQYRGIIYAVNVHIAVVISHTISKWQSDKCRGVGNFAPFLPLNWLPWQRPLRYRKMRVGWIICNSIPTIWCKDCENRSSGS